MVKKLKSISSKELFSNKWWSYRVDEYTWPDDSVGEYHYVRTTGSTMIIPKVDETSFVLTRQYRYLNRKVSLEFPGGGIKKGLDPVHNASEELEEESGYKAGKLSKLGEFNPFNGVTDEICHVFLAEDLTNIGAKPEASEEFDILVLTEKEIEEKINNGELWDGMTLASWSLMLSRRIK